MALFNRKGSSLKVSWVQSSFRVIIHMITGIMSSSPYKLSLWAAQINLQDKPHWFSCRFKGKGHFRTVNSGLGTHYYLHIFIYKVVFLLPYFYWHKHLRAVWKELRKTSGGVRGFKTSFWQWTRAPWCCFQQSVIYNNCIYSNTLPFYICTSARIVLVPYLCEAKYTIHYTCTFRERHWRLKSHVAETHLYTTLVFKD